VTDAPIPCTGTLRPTYGPDGELCLERCVAIVAACPACHGSHVVPVRCLRGFWTSRPCGALVSVTVPASEWRRIEREHRDRPRNVSYVDRLGKACVAARAQGVRA
jgi:hypothetical protein